MGKSGEKRDGRDDLIAEMLACLKRVDGMYGRMFDTTDGRGFLSETSLAKFDIIMESVHALIIKTEGIQK